MPISTKQKKQQLEIQRQAFDLEEKIKKYKDVLPLAGQIAEHGIGFRELLAFHCAVFEKAEAQGIPPDTAAFKVVEEIKQYSELGGLIKQQEQVRQQIWMMNTFTANRNEAIMALCRLQLQGVTEEKILDIDTELQHLNWARKKMSSISTPSSFSGL